MHGLFDRICAGTGRASIALEKWMRAPLRVAAGEMAGFAQGIEFRMCRGAAFTSGRSGQTARHPKTSMLHPPSHSD